MEQFNCFDFCSRKKISYVMVDLSLLVRLCFISMLRLLPLPCKHKGCTSAMVVVSVIKQPPESQELLRFKNSEVRT